MLYTPVQLVVCVEESHDNENGMVVKYMHVHTIGHIKCVHAPLVYVRI